MANITKYLENKLLNHSLGKTAYTPPAATYAGLFITTPDSDYTNDVPNGTEVGSTDHGYIRKAISWNYAGDISDGSIYNSGDITWTATGYWNATTGATVSAPVRYIGVFDAQTGGNLLWFGPLSATITMANGDTFSITSGNLVLTLS